MFFKFLCFSLLLLTNVYTSSMEPKPESNPLKFDDYNLCLASLKKTALESFKSYKFYFFFKDHFPDRDKAQKNLTEYEAHYDRFQNLAHTLYANYLSKHTAVYIRHPTTFALTRNLQLLEKKVSEIEKRSDALVEELLLNGNLLSPCINGLLATFEALRRDTKVELAESNHPRVLPPS